MSKKNKVTSKWSGTAASSGVTVSTGSTGSASSTYTMRLDGKGNILPEPDPKEKNWLDRPDNYRVDVMIDSSYPHAVISTGDLSSYNNNLCGKILTIVDATGIDNQSKKAVKDLIKQSFYQAFDVVHRWMQYDAKREKDFPFTYEYDLKPSDYQP